MTKGYFGLFRFFYSAVNPNVKRPLETKKTGFVDTVIFFEGIEKALKHERPLFYVAQKIDTPRTKHKINFLRVEELAKVDNNLNFKNILIDEK